MPLGKRRNLLYLNSMPFEMIVDQGRMWEITSRDLGGYCRQSHSIYFRSKENKVVEIEPGKNICYCIRNPSEEIKLSIIGHLYRFLHLFTLTFRLIHICRKGKIDAIVSQSNGLRDLELASLIAAKLCSIPMFGYIGRNPTGFEIGKYSCLRHMNIKRVNPVVELERFILRSVDKVILRPGTENIFSKLFRIDRSKIVTIPHTTKFEELSQTSEVPNDLQKWLEGKKIVFYYGRLSPEKLVLDVIKAFNLIRKCREDVLLLLIGDGREKEKLRRLVSELGLANYVRFENSMSQEKIATISSRCDVHVNLVGGKALFESAILGRPLVTYDLDIGHYFGLVEHMHTALIARKRNIESMAKCINKFLNDKNLGVRLGEKLRRRAFQHNDWTGTQNKLSTAIEEAIMAKRSKG